MPTLGGRNCTPISEAFCGRLTLQRCPSGGPGDHVHVLLSLKATHTLSEVTRQMKRGSSLWIHRHGVAKFAWQEGYGAFTVSPSQLSKVQRYIEDQVEHHRKRTFEEEYVELRLNGMEFDEKYLW